MFIFYESFIMVIVTINGYFKIVSFHQSTLRLLYYFIFNKHSFVLHLFQTVPFPSWLNFLLFISYNLSTSHYLTPNGDSLFYQWPICEEYFFLIRFHECRIAFLFLLFFAVFFFLFYPFFPLSNLNI